MMKRLFYIVAVAFFMYACNSGNTDSHQNTSVNWQDEKALDKAVNTYYKDSLLAQNKVYFHIEDAILEQKHVLSLSGIRPKEVYPISQKEAYISADMENKEGNKFVVDIKLVWDENLKIGEKTGNFRVESDFSVQKIDEKARYTWEKQGDYYEKQVVEQQEQIGGGN